MLDRPETTRTGVELRRATADDAEMLWLWRNDPMTRAQSRNSEPIVWIDHVRWLTDALGDPGRRIFVAEQHGTPVGTIRFDRLAGEDADEVSMAVAPGQRGAGIGGAMLKAACAETHAHVIRASVRADNQASRRLFESCGFAPRGSAEPGFLRYVRQIEDRAGSRRKQA
jgi:RimJ/RimL family protein N-acetyltransferase